MKSENKLGEKLWLEIDIYTLNLRFDKLGNEKLQIESFEGGGSERGGVYST